MILYSPLHFFSTTFRKQIPPKSLLQFVDDPDRANNMTLMKALSSLDTTGASMSSSNECSRAKMASGVAVLMETQAQPSDTSISTQWLKHFGPPIVIRPKAQRTLKQRLRRLSRSIVRRLPQNQWNRLALTWLAFNIVYVVCMAIFNLHFFFTTYLPTLAH